MRNFLALTACLFAVAVASADLTTDFAAVNKNAKGPFGLNVLQGTLGSQNVASTGRTPSPPGKYQFQAAYRTPLAQGMARNYDFYIGNLFTTNYYELMCEFVFFNSFGVVDLGTQTALTFTPAMPKALSMVRNWVLEKHYVNTLPESKLARSFQLRGVAGAEFEQQYAAYFFNFYLNGVTTDFEYLPAYLLAKASPLSSSASLEKARNLISAMYTAESEPYTGPFANGEVPIHVKRLYQVRNIIHNQLTPEIIAYMNKFAKDFPFYGEDPRFIEIRTILTDYFNIDAKKLLVLTKKSGSAQLNQLVERIAAGDNSVQNLYALSSLTADLRTAVTDKQLVPMAKKTDTLLLILKISQYLNMELTRLPRITSKEAVKAAINLTYAEGFLIKDNQNYFLSEIDAAADLQATATTLTDMIDIANDTLSQAFSPTLDTWLRVEPKMRSFADNIIKSSSLTTVSAIAMKVKGN